VSLGKGMDRYRSNPKKTQGKRAVYVKPTGAKLEGINLGLAARKPYALAIAIIAGIGALIALYMFITEFMGGVPVCGPIGGCDTVANSPYSYIDGGGVQIRVSLIGFFGATAAVALAAMWWRGGEVRPLQVLYLGMLVAVIGELYLIYLQLFVIHAICIWCMGFGLTMFGTFAVSWITLLRMNRPNMKNPGR
jgi:uncharacterized membrane protein